MRRRIPDERLRNGYGPETSNRILSVYNTFALTHGNALREGETDPEFSAPNTRHVKRALVM
ncbi:hypothetical protein ElyMa_002948200, partial [Elysia marginata]